ncbi:hypothetical protein M422DRAFT_773805 [Sphaerobolus stellatus SS14]|nr:hypothetical protein M422DRAFT_773805 [Sphaerobolus stellatus SS14]
MSVQDLATAVLAGRISSYVSVASSVVVFYDHILLLNQEIGLIWASKWSKWKALFLLNRYFVLPCFVWMGYQLSGLSSASYTALRRSILIALVTLYISIYVTTIVLCTLDIVDSLAPHTSLQFRICALGDRLPLIAVAYSLPLILDVILLILTCWNALERPINIKQTTLTQELMRDGIVYFAISISLRVFNVIVFSKIAIVYTNLAWPALWAILTAVVSRMIIFGTKESQAVRLEGFDPKARLRGQLDIPFSYEHETSSLSSSYLENNLEEYSGLGQNIQLQTILPEIMSNSRISWI